MGRKSRRSGGRAQLGTRQSLGRAMRNKQLGAKSRRQQQLQQEQPWWSRAREPRFPTRAMQLTTIRSRDWEFINEINVRGVLIFLAIGNPTGRGGGHALLPVEDFFRPTNLQRPAGIPRTIDMSTGIGAFSSLLAFENIISPAFATI